MAILALVGDMADRNMGTIAMGMEGSRLPRGSAGGGTGAGLSYTAIDSQRADPHYTGSIAVYSYAGLERKAWEQATGEGIT